MTRIAALVMALFTASWAEAHKPTVTTFTFHKDIYPIFSTKCGGCHREGGVAPMSLLSYQESYPWAVAIKNEVLNLAMPPAFADERYGAFQHAGGLTPTEMNTIVDWCLGGSPEGDGSESVASDVRPGSLGPPELELAMVSAVTLGPDSNERRSRLSVGKLPEDVFVRAFDVRPGAPNIVRSALVFAGDALVGSWIPGSPPAAYPEGTGLALQAGTQMALEIQYRKTWLDEGVAVEDQSVLALYLVSDVEATIERTVVNGAPVVFDEPVSVIALLPTVAERGGDFVAEVVRASGERESILRLHEPSPDFPRAFWLQTPLSLPAGDGIESSHPLLLSLVRR